MKAYYLSGRTALHFAAVSGHVRCIRLVVADLVPSAPYETLHARVDADVGDGSNTKRKNEQRSVIPLHCVILKKITILVNFILYFMFSR